MGLNSLFSASDASFGIIADNSSKITLYTLGTLKLYKEGSTTIKTQMVTIVQDLI